MPRRWRAATSRAIHPGLGNRHNTKFVRVEAYDTARNEVRESRVDEVLLFDSDGFLVEGSHSNLLLATDAGELLTPSPELGAVEGLGLTIVRESHPEIRDARLERESVLGARELMSVNCVRGVVPITELDGIPVSTGEPGPWARRLGVIFFRDATATNELHLST